MPDLWRSAVIAFTVSMVAGPIVVATLRRFRVLDMPTERSLHHLPTPRGGGLAPALGAVAAVAAVPVPDSASWTGLLVTAVSFGLIGLVEDWRGVSPIPRLAWQLAVAGLALVLLLHRLSGPTVWQVVFAAGCVVWLVAYVNAFNFMDGINGIAAAQTLIAGTVWLTIGEIEDVTPLAAGGAVIAAAALAFAPLNYPRAHVFLGDVGSYFIGAWLGALVIVALRAGLPPEAVIAPVSLYLADTATTLVRRIRAAAVWYLPHRSHAYQRLVQLGWSHTRTTAVVALVMLVCSGLGAVSLTGSLGARVAADIALAAVLAAYVGSPDLLARPSRSVRRKPPQEGRRRSGFGILLG